MNYAKLMQLEIDKKRKLPDTVKSSIRSNIFICLVSAIVICLYIVVIDLIYKKCDIEMFEQYMKYFALAIVVVTVILFEVSYRLKSRKFFTIGFEFFCYAVLSLYIPYIFIHTNMLFRNIVMALPAALTVYYAIKSYAIYKAKKIYHQSHLSDIKEIMNDKSEKLSYLDEESGKTYRAKKAEEKVILEEIKKEQELRKKKKLLEAKKKAQENKEKNKKKNK